MKKIYQLTEKHWWTIEYRTDYILVQLERLEMTHWLWGQCWVHVTYPELFLIGNETRPLGSTIHGFFNGRISHASQFQFTKEDFNLKQELDNRYELYKKIRDEREAKEKLLLHKFNEL